MKKHKRLLSLLLALTLVFGMIPTAFATETSEATDPTAATETTATTETTVPASSEPETSEPTESVPAESKPTESTPAESEPAASESSEPSTEATETSEATTAPTEALSDGEKVLTTGKLSAGTLIYKEPNGESYEVQGVGTGIFAIKEYSVEIVEAKVVDGTNWYRYQTTGKLGGLIDAVIHTFSQYPWVKGNDVELDAPIEIEPEVDELGIPLCSCQYAEGVELKNHADDCARKSYLRGTYIVEKSAEEIYADWKKMDEATQEAVQEFLSWDNQTKFAELNALIDPDGPLTVETESGVKVSATGNLPENAVLVVGEAIADGTFSRIITHASDIFFQKTLDIHIEVDGDKWEPTEPVMITLALGRAFVGKLQVNVVHILESASAIAYEFDMMNADSYTSSGLGEVLTEACAAAEAAGLGNDTVAFTNYVGFCSGEELGNDGVITFTTNSFSDFIVSVAEAEESDQSSATTIPLVVDKYVENHGNGTYTLTLEAYTTAKVEGVPTDIVLLLDRSGSMYDAASIGTTLSNGVYMDQTLTFEQLNALSPEEKNNGPQQPGYYMMAHSGDLWHIAWNGSEWVKYEQVPSDYKTGTVKYHRRDTIGKALDTTDESEGIFYKSIFGVSYDGVKTFLDEISGALNTRVAIASFGRYNMENTGEEDWVGTGVYNGGTFYKYNSITDYYNSTTFKSSFKSVSNTNELQQLYDSLAIYEPAINQTATGAGLRITQKLFENASSTTTKHITIIFTDGEPSSTGAIVTESQCYTKEEATGSLAVRHAMKQVDILKTDSKYLSEVYAIGPKGGNATPATMCYLSSDPDDKYYHNPSAEETAEVFRNIAGVIVEQAAALNKNTAVVDEISPYFALPDNIQTSDIKVYTAACTGKSGNDFTFATDRESFAATIDMDTKAKNISVSNFDWNTNAVYVDKTNHGKKLIIEIPIVPEEDFLGGEDVPTNDPSSGIYNSSTRLTKFPEPITDVTLKQITPVTNVKNIYVSQSSSIPDLINLGKYSFSDDQEVPYEVDGINNAYVNITYKVEELNAAGESTGKYIQYTIPESTGAPLTDTWIENELMTHNRLTEDTTYKVTCTVESKKENTKVTPTVGYENQTVHVFKPVITFQDSSIDLGQTANYDNITIAEPECNLAEIVWVNSSSTDKPETEPTLEFEYIPVKEDADFKSDTNVKVVTVVAKKDDNNAIPEDMHIIEYVTFYRDTCDFEGCDQCGENKTSIPVPLDNNRVNFIVHLNTFDLEIVKQVEELYSAADSFVFDVDGCGEDITVVINGNGSVIIKGLAIPSGNNCYTVSEDRNWSSRYTPDPLSCSVNNAYIKANAKNGVVTVTFSNTLNNDKWLGDSSYAVNLFGKNDNYGQTIE